MRNNKAKTQLRGGEEGEEEHVHEVTTEKEDPGAVGGKGMEMKTREGFLNERKKKRGSGGWGENTALRSRLAVRRGVELIVAK